MEIHYCSWLTRDR